MKKKKRKVLTREEKILIICVAIVAFLLILAISLALTKRGVKQQTDRTYQVNQELNTVQEVIEYLGSTYYSQNKSSVEGYDLDIYVSFKCNLYEEDKSEELYFTNLYEKVAMVTGFKSFRLIDNGKKITIEVKCSSTGITEVKINGEENYFKNEASRRSKENELNVDVLDLEVNSSELEQLIEANWNVSEVNIGTSESRYNKYDIYFDEGFEIKTTKGKVYNMVFNEKYNKKVVEGLKPGENLERVETVLGTSYKDSSILGYKTKDYYIYFSAKQISIYPRYKVDYTEFENLIEEYNVNRDINDFADKLTDIWPDYDKYSYDTNYFEIDYTVKGVKVQYSSSNPEGIQIYENYSGPLREEKTDYKDVYYKLNKNLIIEKETERLMQVGLYDNSGIEEDPIHYSNRFYLNMTADGNFFKNIKVLSLDENYPNNELDETTTIYTYVWADDSHLIYSIYDDGIYIYDAEARTTQKIIGGDESYRITDYNRDTNVMKYDDKEVKIRY